MRGTLSKLKGEANNFRITVDDFNILLSAIGTLSIQEISKNISNLNNAINCLDLVDIDRTPYPHDSFPKTDYILGHKSMHNTN